MILHEKADEHAPFMHYVIPWQEVRSYRVNRHAPLITVVVDSGVHVICGFCRHWINRPMKNCNCLASCHAESLASSQVTG